MGLKLKSLPWLLLSASSQLNGAEQADVLLDLSLEDLLKVKVLQTATITTMDEKSAPAAISIITQKAIASTPARNIYDLIETYVPGAFWMNHEEGPHLGVRGNIVNRNYKYLLRLNNRVLNNKAFFGAKSELELWELSDIYQIEIVRGPGSVVFGPGAVAGVINIITKDAKNYDSSEFAVSYFDEYESKGFSVNHVFKFRNKPFYQHFSLRDTEGVLPHHFLVTRDNEIGAIGADILLGEQPLDYFNDAQNKPQIKWHLDTYLNKEWRLWLRYTQQGSSWRGNEVKTESNGQLLNQQSMRDRQFIVTAENELKLENDIRFKGMISFDSYDVERRIERLRDPEPDHPLNKRLDFSEDELLIRGQFNWNPSTQSEVAIGMEYSYDHFGPGWGDDPEDMRIGEAGNIVSGPNSRAIRSGNGGSADDDGTEIFVGSGWHTDTYSVFAEANWQANENNRWLFSARADKNTFSDWVISPRVAYLYDLSEQEQLKVIAQNSVRLNTAGQLFSDDVNQSPSDEETLNGFEVIYSAHRNDELFYSMSLFKNDIDVIAWQGDENQTTAVGALSLYGFEFELKSRFDWGDLGFNLSTVSLDSWEMAEGITSSGISYADYNEAVGDGIQTGYGKNLNNWPSDSIKIFTRIDFSDDLIFHIDTRYFSDMHGALDGLTGLQNAVDGTADEAAVNQVIAELNEQNIYQSDFRLNAQLNYQLSENLSFQLFVLNLYGSNENRRYSYDTGNDDPAPRRVRFIEEPRAIGVKVKYRF